MYPPHSYGGYEQSCRDVVERWRARGHEVLVLTGRVRVPGAVDDPGGGDDEPFVRREQHLYWEDHRMLSPAPPRRLVWELSNRRSLRRALGDFAPDVVSAWAMGAMSLGLLTEAGRRHLPVVAVICDEWPVYGPEADGWLRPLYRRPALGRAVRLISGLPTDLPPLDSLGPSCFISEFLRTRSAEQSRWSFENSAVVYSGIAATEFPFCDRRFRPWGWRLLYTGRIDPRKGITTAIAALGSCPPESTLVVDGRGDDEHRIELAALAERSGLGDRVTFTTSPRAGLAAQLAAADAAVFPPEWDEPFGLVPIEAMSCGTPVVASPMGGAAEFLVDGVNCLTFPAGDHGALAAALHRLAGDPLLRRRLIEGGRVTAAELTVDQLAEVLERWHQHARSPKTHPRPADRGVVI